MSGGAVQHREGPLVTLFVLLALSFATGCASTPRHVEGTANIYLPGSPTREQVRYRVVGDVAVYQGDIVLGPVNEVEGRYASPRLLRSGPGTTTMGATAMSSGDFRWPQGHIPYVIDDSVGAQERDNIAFAVSRLGTAGLQLRPRTPADRDSIRFVEKGHCWSYYGRQGGEQLVTLGGCGRGGAIHEVLHAAGFYHEHARPDRDAYVTINWNEISDGEESNFQIQQTAKTIGPYDFESVMHYHAQAFSKTGAPTIVARNPGQRLSSEDLSAGDIAGIREIYALGGGIVPPGLVPPGLLPPGLLPPGVTPPGGSLPEWLPLPPGALPPGALPSGTQPLPTPPAELPFPLPW
jgi:hypothetical protein